MQSLDPLRFGAAFLAVGALALGGACVPGADRSAGGEPRAWGDSLVLVEEMRIGELAGEEAYTFGSVAALAPALDGSFYLVDRQVPVIRRYDREGTHLGDIGRQGEGPGEYQRPDGLAVMPDGSVVVWDTGMQRLSRFGADGSLLGSSSVARRMGGWRGLVYGTDGAVFMKGVLADRSQTGDLMLEWVRVDLDGGIQPAWAVPPAEPEGPNYTVSGRGGSYRPFVTETLNTMSPDGSLYVARNDEYAIQRITPAGDTTTIRREESPIRVAPQELAEWEAFSEMFAEVDPANRSNYFPVPRVKPFIRELVVDLEGRLWVSRYTEPVFMEYSPEERAQREEQGLPPYQWRDALTWDVFDPSGDLLGVVTLPLRTTFSTAIGEHVWGVQSGEFREDNVVRWRIEAVQDEG